MFLLRDTLITQGEKRETSVYNLQRNDVARQVESFCISYFAAFSALKLLINLQATQANNEVTVRRDSSVLTC